MKKMIVSAAMLILTAAAAVANTTAKTTTTIETTTDNDKTQVDPNTLPDPVKTTLASDDYKGWKASGAWLVKTEPSYYEVELKKDDQSKTVKIDKDGKVK